VNFEAINELDEAAFVATLGGIFEHSPWVARRAHAARPYASIDALHATMLDVVRRATRDEQLALIRAHPELAGRAMIAKTLTADSTSEQSSAGLTRCSPAEYATLVELNARYNAKFGFPFILAVKGYDRQGVIAEFARRVERDEPTEFAEALLQIARITGFRLRALIQT
jgi:2-oxo-4-hydroxy-4-carboxy-5-ureidoimidazoline decarboxylase